MTAVSFPRRIVSAPTTITVISAETILWPTTVPVSSYASIPIPTQYKLSQVSSPLYWEAYGIQRSYSGIPWNESYGTGGAALFTGGGHAAGNYPFAWLFDGSLPGWRALNTTMPSGATNASQPAFKYADGAEFSFVQGNMPADAVYFNNYTTGYWYKRQGSDPQYSAQTSLFNYGECATGVPMGFHTYNMLFAIPPGKLGMGAQGGFGTLVKASCTTNSALGCAWGHKIDAVSGVWSRMPERLPEQNTGGGTFYDNYLATWTKAAVEGNYAYTFPAERCTGIVKTDLTTGVNSVLVSQNAAVSISNIVIIPGTYIACQLVSANRNNADGNSARNSLQAINLDPNAGSRQWAVVTMPSNTMPIGTTWQEYTESNGAANLMWVPEVGKFAVFGQSSSTSNLWPMKLFWITPPANVQSTYNSGTWTMTEEALTIPAGDTKASTAANRNAGLFQTCHWSSKLRCFIHLPIATTDCCFFIRTALVP